jgi:hypothetical protein
MECYVDGETSITHNRMQRVNIYGNSLRGREVDETLQDCAQ